MLFFSEFGCRERSKFVFFLEVVNILKYLLHILSDFFTGIFQSYFNDFGFEISDVFFGGVVVRSRNQEEVETYLLAYVGIFGSQEFVF